MRPLLATIKLPQVQEIRIGDVRSLAEHKPVGKDGSLLQDLGRMPTCLTLWGVASSPDGPDLIERLKAEMRTGQPVTFVANITSGTQLEQVIIDDVEVRQLAGRPDRFAYAITLLEYLEPAAPEDDSLLQTDLLDDVSDRFDDLVTGLGLAAGFATGLERFVQPLEGLLGRLATFRDQLEAQN